MNVRVKLVVFFIAFAVGTLWASPGTEGRFRYSLRSDLQSTLDSTVPGLYTQVEAELLSVLNTLDADVETSIPADTQTNFLKSMASSGVGASRGLGLDYASNPDIFTVGFGLGAGTTGLTDLINGNVAENALPSFGAAAGMSAVVGLNARRVGLKDFWKIKTNRLNLYLNVMSYSLNVDKFRFSTFSLGAHGQYKIIPQKAILPFKMLHWGGVDVSTGFDYLSMEVLFQNKYSFTEVDTSNPPYTTKIRWDVTGRVGADTGVFTIPIEASTNLQFLYIFTLFGGLGLDLNLGSTSSIADVGGDFSYIVSNAGTVQAEVIGGNATLDLSETQHPPIVDLRAFAGIQMNIWALKLVLSGGWATGDTYNINMFFRVAY
ncbi:MAG: hypothetical protein D6767_03440 [Candidatus Hydrogenedentota bacterium]|nr:MAG: hypothetical protein D6767_03440 [Candidatus Hydrogenedentota bacterium]